MFKLPNEVWLEIFSYCRTNQCVKTVAKEWLKLACLSVKVIAGDRWPYNDRMLQMSPEAWSAFAGLERVELGSGTMSVAHALEGLAQSPYLKTMKFGHLNNEDSLKNPTSELFSSSSIGLKK
jgi:hypothetical protein